MRNHHDKTRIHKISRAVRTAADRDRRKDQAKQIAAQEKRHRPEAAKTFTCSTGDHADRMQMYGAITAETGRGG